MGADIIGDSLSTKGQPEERDPEMHRVKKGNRHRLGMQVEIGLNAEGV